MNGNDTMRNLSRMMAACLVTLLAACGGGGGDDAPAAKAPMSAAENKPVQPVPEIDANGPSAMPTASDAANTVPVEIKAGSGQLPNFPVVSVTICAPGSNAGTNCATIDNVLLDTGSFGLRLFASAIPSGTLAALTPQKSGASSIAECALFADSNGWGTVRNADVKMASEVAQNIAINVWADPSASADVPSAAPSPCQVNTSLNKVADLGANGILGVGVAAVDCPTCGHVASSQFYYTCLRQACTASIQPVANQVANPVSRFMIDNVGRDNNGLILEMPPVADAGQDSVVGTLVFGIDTAPNNALSGAGAVLLTTAASGDFNATYKGSRISGFTDSGSNGFFFQDDSLPVLHTETMWYEPPTTQALSVSVASKNAASGTPGNIINFHVANADALFSTNASAFNNLAGSIPGSFDLGMPFFYGRHVYYGISNLSSAGGGTGPYVAYVSK